MLSRTIFSRLRPTFSLVPRRFISDAAIPAVSNEANPDVPKASDYGDDKYFEANDKTGIIVTLEDQRGVLNKALSVFDKNKVDLTHIQSKPSKYYKKTKAFDFYLDFMGTLEDESVRNVIGDLSRMSKHLTI